MLARMAIIAAIMLAPTIAHSQEKLARRPNILWITCEDMGPHLGSYGDAYAVTPHLDALAKKSLRYKRVWSNAPVCAPARTTIIAGMYPTTLGAHHMRSLVPLPGDVKLLPELLRRLGYFCTNNVKEDYNVIAGKGLWNESSGKAHYRNRPKDQPFFAVFNFIVTHESQIRKRPHTLVHDPAKVSIPTYHPDTPEVRRDWAQYYDNISTMDAAVGKLLAELEAEGLLEDTIVIFFSDHGSGMPRNKRTPLNCGLHVPMLVHIPDGYRDLAPKDYAAGGTTDRLVSFVDLAPTMLSIAGERPAPFMQGHAFLGKQIAAPPEHLFGFRGRMDERYDLVRSVTDGRYVYARNFMPHRIAGQHVAYMFETPTTKVWKKLFDEGKLNAVQSQFWKPRPAEELYDLQTDSHEIENLATAAEHAAVKKRLSDSLKKHLKATRDLDFLPEDEIHSRSRELPPMTMGRDAKAFPLERIFETAWMMSDVSQPIAANEFTARSADDDSAVRYWAAVGIRGRGEGAVRENAPLLLKLLDDPAPSVRIIAAEALGTHGNPVEVSKAVATLTPLVDLKANSVYVSMQALSAFDSMGARAAPAWPTIREVPAGEVRIEPRLRTGPSRLVESIRGKLPTDR